MGGGGDARGQNVLAVSFKAQELEIKMFHLVLVRPSVVMDLRGFPLSVLTFPGVVGPGGQVCMVPPWSGVGDPVGQVCTQEWWFITGVATDKTVLGDASRLINYPGSFSTLKYN